MKSEQASSFYGILFALIMYALNDHGFFIPIRCINFGMVHYLYIEGSQLIIAKFNYISFSVHPFFIRVANSVDHDEMRHFV